MSTKIELKFSDIDFGCDEYGFIPRPEVDLIAEDQAEAEDRRYMRYLKARGVKANVVDGMIYVKETT